MVDLAVAYKKYKFIGSEFLTWVFYVARNESFRIREDLEIGISHVITSISFENDSPKEVLSIKGDDSIDMDECTSAIGRGGFVSKIRLSIEVQNTIFNFVINADSLSVSSLNLPFAESTHEDQDGALLERIYLYDLAVKAVEKLFERFVRLRISNEWPSVVVDIQKWITSAR